MIYISEQHFLKAHSRVWDIFLAIERPLKVTKNAFHFMLKALLVLEIFTFLSEFLVKKENTFMTSQTEQQIIKIHILLNISRSKGNQTMRFLQLMKLLGKSFLLNSCKKWGWETSSDLLLLFKKALCKVKTGIQHLSFNLFWWTSTWTYNRSKLWNILDCWSGDMLNSNFL